MEAKGSDVDTVDKLGIRKKHRNKDGRQTSQIFPNYCYSILESLQHILAGLALLFMLFISFSGVLRLRSSTTTPLARPRSWKMARHIPEPQETQEAKPELKESQPKEPKEPMDAGPNLLICCGFNLFEV